MKGVNGEHDDRHTSPERPEKTAMLPTQYRRLANLLCMGDVGLPILWTDLRHPGNSDTDKRIPQVAGKIQCRRTMGGLFSSYYRDAG